MSWALYVHAPADSRGTSSCRCDTFFTSDASPNQEPRMLSYSSNAVDLSALRVFICHFSRYSHVCLHAVAVLSMAVLVLIGHIAWLYTRVRRLKGRESTVKHKEEAEACSKAVQGLCLACERIQQLSSLANGPGPDSFACPADSSYRPANNSTSGAPHGYPNEAIDWKQVTPEIAQDVSRGRGTHESNVSCKEAQEKHKDCGATIDSLSVSNGSMVSMSVPVRSGSPCDEGQGHTITGTSATLQGSRLRTCCASGTCQCSECSCGRYCSPACRRNSLRRPSRHASQSDLGVNAVRTSNTVDSDADSTVYRSLGLKSGCKTGPGTSSEVKKRTGDTSQHNGRQSPTMHSLDRGGSYSSEFSNSDVDQPPRMLTSSPLTLSKLKRIGAGVNTDGSPSDGPARAETHPGNVSTSSAGSVSLALTHSIQTPAHTPAKATVSTAVGGSPSSQAQQHTPDSPDQGVESIPYRESSPQLNKQLPAASEHHGNDLEADSGHNGTGRDSWRWWPFAQAQRQSPAQAEVQTSNTSNHVHGNPPGAAASSPPSTLPTLSPPMSAPPDHAATGVSSWWQHSSVDVHTANTQQNMHAEHAQSQAQRAVKDDSGKFLRSASFPSTKAMPGVLGPSVRSSLDSTGLSYGAISAVSTPHLPHIASRVQESITNGRAGWSSRSLHAETGTSLGLPRPSSLTEVASAARKIMQMSENGCSRRRSTTALAASTRYSQSSVNLARASAPQVLLNSHEQHVNTSHSRSHSHSSQNGVHSQSAVPSAATAHLSAHLSPLRVHVCGQSTGLASPNSGGSPLGSAYTEAAHLMSPSAPPVAHMPGTHVMSNGSSGTHLQPAVVMNLPYTQNSWGPSNEVQMHAYHVSSGVDMTLPHSAMSHHTAVPQFQPHMPGHAASQHAQHAGGSHPLTSSMLAAFGVGGIGGTNTHSALSAHSGRAPSARAGAVNSTTSAYGGMYQMGSPPSSLLSVASSDAQVAKEKVSHAVTELREALAAELKHNDVQFNRVIGRGGFGTVYHGSLLLSYPC